MNFSEDVPRLACSGKTQLFLSLNPEDLEKATRLCRDCPKRVACLDRAINLKEKWGVYGGVLIFNGRIITQYTKRVSGRPAKNFTPPQLQVDRSLIPDHLGDLVDGEPPKEFARRIKA